MKIIYTKIGTLLRNLMIKFGFSDGGSFYINGPETLPPPLSSEDEAEVLSMLGTIGDSDARERLIVHNLRLVVYIAKKFDAAGASLEDLISIGTIGLIKAVNTFCPDKNIKLATYASRCIENEILMYIRKSSSLKSEISIDEPLNVDWDGNELLLSDVLGSDGSEVGGRVEEEDERRLLISEIEKLNIREKEIMSMRFGLYGKKEHTQKQVADIMGISQSYISRLEKRILIKLKKEMERSM